MNENKIGLISYNSSQSSEISGNNLIQRKSTEYKIITEEVKITEEVITSSTSKNSSGVGIYFVWAVIIITIFVIAYYIYKFFLKKNIVSTDLSKSSELSSDYKKILDDYFSSGLIKYYKHHLFLEYIINFFSINNAARAELKNKYFDDKLKPDFPIAMDRLLDNLEAVNNYLMVVSKRYNIVTVNKKYEVLTGDIQKYLLEKAHKEVLNAILPHIKDKNEINKWNEISSSKPSLF